MGWFKRNKNGERDHADSPSAASSDIAKHPDQNARGTVPAGDGPYRIDDAFTRLAGELASTGSNEAMNRLWKSVFELEHWHFINQFPPDGSAPQGPPPFGWPRPMTARVDGKLYVMAYTSAERARAAAQLNNLVHPQFGIALLEIQRDGAAEMLCKMDSRSIDGVLFNYNEGETGFYAPLSNVATMFEWHLDRVPPRLFDAFVRGVVACNVPRAWERLHRRLALMERWFFVGDQKRPGAPQLYPYEGNPTLLVFTDEDHVVRGAGAAGGADEQGRLPLIPTTPPDAALYAQQLAAHSGGPGDSRQPGNRAVHSPD